MLCMQTNMPLYLDGFAADSCPDLWRFYGLCQDQCQDSCQERCQERCQANLDAVSVSDSSIESQ